MGDDATSIELNPIKFEYGHCSIPHVTEVSKEGDDAFIVSDT